MKHISTVLPEVCKAVKQDKLSNRTVKFLTAASEIRLDPGKVEFAFMARQLVQATLPHSDPGNKPVWSRKNGNLVLTIKPGSDKDGKTIGYPYGTLPRLVLFWLSTEVVQTKTQRIFLGESFSEFMKELGLDPSRGGDRSDFVRLGEQMERLFRSTISFDQVRYGRKSWLDMQIAPQGIIWWNAKEAEHRKDKQPEGDTNPDEPLLRCYIELGEHFFQAILDSPIPCDMRAIRALKQSPLALDLYTWAAHVAYQTKRNGKSRTIAWDLMHSQFGAEYTSLKEFSRKAWKALLKVKTVYPGLNIQRIRGGVQILPSEPAVMVMPPRPKKQTHQAFSEALLTP